MPARRIQQTWREGSDIRAILQDAHSKPPWAYWNGLPRPTREEDVRNIRHREMEGPRPQTCPLLPLGYSTIPRPPHPAMRWE